MDEAWVLQYLTQLCKEEPRSSGNDGVSERLLPGTCTGKEYVPVAFRDKQRRQVDAYFRTNGLIELSVLSRYQVYKSHWCMLG